MNEGQHLSDVIFVYSGSEEELEEWRRRSRGGMRRFLRTDRSRHLYKEIIKLLRDFAATDWAKKRLSLLFPLTHVQEIMRMREIITEATREIGELSMEHLREIKEHLRILSSLNEPSPAYQASVSVVAENEKIYTKLLEMGINRWYPIHTPATVNRDSDLIIYVYDKGNIEFEWENVVMLSQDSPREAIVPEIVLSFFEENRSVLEHALWVQKIRKRDTILQRVIELLEEKEESAINLRGIAEEALKIAENEFRKAVEGMTIEGKEVLALLTTGMPQSIASHLRSAEMKARKYFKEKTGIELPIDTTVFPFSLIEKEMERAVKDSIGQREVRRFEDRVRRAKELMGIKEKVMEEIRELLLFDLKSSIVEFAERFDLNMPTIEPNGNRIVLRGAAHLKLVQDPQCKKVDYSFGGEDNVVILTGANSGGKTTLLETITQTVILAQMGLPVCAEEAVLPVFQEVHFHSQKKTMNAGAFEEFLKTFIPTVVSEKKKLIVADELEAITELDAGAKIIASVLNRVKESDSLALVVSHMPDEISARLRVRIDGIEAKGLDENLELIVDRTPRIGYRARSTPELIVQRLYSLSTGKEKGVYSEILESFKEGGKTNG